MPSFLKQRHRRDEDRCWKISGATLGQKTVSTFAGLLLTLCNFAISQWWHPSHPLARLDKKDLLGSLGEEVATNLRSFRVASIGERGEADGDSDWMIVSRLGLEWSITALMHTKSQ